MKILDYFLRAPASSTDNAPVRFDGTTGDLGQSTSTATLDDTGILTLSDLAGAIVVGGTVSTVVVAGVTLTPGALLHTTLGTRPNLIMLRISGTPGTGATSAPTFNYMRARGSPGAEVAVNNGDSIGIFSASGYDGTDYASGSQIDTVVDEADTGTAAVGANQMGSKIRFLTSRRTTQTPTLSAQIRHNGALQLNTGITLAPLTNTGMGGSLEADTKVLYYTPEDASRGVVGAKYIICPTGANTLTATTGLQALFDDVGAGTLTLPTGTYLWTCLASFNNMEAAAATNLLFDYLGAGTATTTGLWMADGGDGAATGAVVTTRSMMVVGTASANPIFTGVANANLQMRAQGLFRVTVAGTIIPSINLGTNGGTPARTLNSFFVCECIGSSTVQTVGAWT